MAESTPPHKRTPPPPPDPRDRRALLDAYQTLVRTEQERQAAGPPAPAPPPSRSGFWLLSLLLIGALSALLVIRPSWMFTTPPSESPALMEASLRVQMFVEIERIEKFRSDSGRIPASEAEAGLTAGSGLGYLANGANYTLTGTNGPVALTYSSGTPPAEFLGKSYEIVRARGTQ